MDKLGSSPTSRVDVNTIMRKPQTRVWKMLERKPEFIISVAETQNVLDKFATSKMNFYFECGPCGINKAIYDTPFR
jgi:hypothetical protein